MSQLDHHSWLIRAFISFMSGFGFNSTLLPSLIRSIPAPLWDICDFTREYPTVLIRFLFTVFVWRSRYIKRCISHHTGGPPCLVIPPSLLFPSILPVSWYTAQFPSLLLLYSFVLRKPNNSDTSLSIFCFFLFVSKLIIALKLCHVKKKKWLYLRSPPSPFPHPFQR